MKFRLPLIAGLVSLLVSLSLVAGAGAASTAKAAKPKHKCTVAATQQTSGKTTGYDFATTKCSAPYGSGLGYITYVEGASTTGKASDSGTFKAYYNRGTIHGTYALSGPLPTTGPITLTGIIKVLGGTGAFAGTKAKGPMTCTSSDAGAHITCVAKF
jgi:hypothetical protein